MTFRRPTPVLDAPPPHALTAQMTGLGMLFAAEPATRPDIERTLVFASRAGMGDDDLRVLSVLTTWLGVHHPWVHADRLVRLVDHEVHERVLAFWSAVAMWLGRDRRFARLSRFYAGPRLDLLRVGSDFQIARRGEDARFAETCLRVPAGTLRERDSDVLSPEALAQRHPGYRNRVLMGPSWRADVWTELEAADEDLTAAEAARRAGCGFATAWQVKRDFDLLRRATAH